MKKQPIFDIVIENKGNICVRQSTKAWMPPYFTGSDEMSINIQAKQDYSYLFGSLGSSGSSMGNLNFLSDYASIKNGSYFKLMKAYYSEGSTSKQASSIVNSKKNNMSGNSVSADSNKTLAKVQSSTDKLKESADALLATGKDSLFAEKEITTVDDDGNKKTTKGYDKDAIYSAVSDFVKNYNSVLDASDDVNSTSILNRTASMVSATAANEKLLSSIGVTIGKDNSLSVDKETFMDADMTTVKSLFNGNYSYGYRVSAQASMINFAADNEAAKSGTYSGNGSYTNNYTSGNIFNSIF